MSRKRPLLYRVSTDRAIGVSQKTFNDNLENYGEVSSYPPAIHYQAVGWYDNDAANLSPVAPMDEAERIVPLMGGRDSVLAAAAEAMEKKEYSWAAQLVNYFYRLDPTDAEVRRRKAEALRQMAYVSTGANNRAHLISQALALEGKVTLPRVAPPAPETIAAFPATFVDYFRVRIDPVASGETDSVLRFDFPDSKSAGLQVRRAVAEFIEDSDAYPRDPDILLKLSSEAWAKVYLSAAPLDELIGGEEIDATQGDAAEAARVLGLFDRYDPDRAVVVPPTNPGAGAHVAPLQSRLKEHAYEGVQADESDDNAVGVAADTLEGPCRSRACCR